MMMFVAILSIILTIQLEINGDINAYDVNDDKDVSEILQSLALEPMQTLRLVQLLLQVTRRLNKWVKLLPKVSIVHEVNSAAFTDKETCSEGIMTPGKMPNRRLLPQISRL